jgi:hypothetical protein
MIGGRQRVPRCVSLGLRATIATRHRARWSADIACGTFRFSKENVARLRLDGVEARSDGTGMRIVSSCDAHRCPVACHQGVGSSAGVRWISPSRSSVFAPDDGARHRADRFEHHHDGGDRHETCSPKAATSPHLPRAWCLHQPASRSRVSRGPASRTGFAGAVAPR